MNALMTFQGRNGQGELCVRRKEVDIIVYPPTRAYMQYLEIKFAVEYGLSNVTITNWLLLSDDD